MFPFRAAVSVFLPRFRIRVRRENPIPSVERAAEWLPSMLLNLMLRI